MGGKTGGVRSSRGGKLGLVEEEVAGEGDMDGKVSGSGVGLSAKSGLGMVLPMGGDDQEGRKESLELALM